MTRKAPIGEFEQLVLLAALRLGSDAFAPRIARLLEERAGREMSRGTLYAALERLEDKGLLTWEVQAPPPEGGRSNRRLFEVTPAGRAALAASRTILLSLWDGVEHLLTEEGA